MPKLNLNKGFIFYLNPSSDFNISVKFIRSNYYNGWRLVDPTFGWFDNYFQVQDYYDRVITAKGIEIIDVKVRV